MRYSHLRVGLITNSQKGRLAGEPNGIVALGSLGALYPLAGSSASLGGGSRIRGCSQLKIASLSHLPDGSFRRISNVGES
jgi:hypothetical protein